MAQSLLEANGLHITFSDEAVAHAAEQYAGAGNARRLPLCRALLLGVGEHFVAAVTPRCVACRACRPVAFPRAEPPAPRRRRECLLRRVVGELRWGRRALGRINAHLVQRAWRVGGSEQGRPKGPILPEYLAVPQSTLACIQIMCGAASLRCGCTTSVAVMTPLTRTPPPAPSHAQVMALKKNYIRVRAERDKLRASLEDGRK